jgi:hypothetical protein
VFNSSGGDCKALESFVDGAQASDAQGNVSRLPSLHVKIDKFFGARNLVVRHRVKGPDVLDIWHSNFLAQLGDEFLRQHVQRKTDKLTLVLPQNVGESPVKIGSRVRNKPQFRSPHVRVLEGKRVGQATRKEDHFAALLDLPSDSYRVVRSLIGAKKNRLIIRI